LNLVATPPQPAFDPRMVAIGILDIPPEIHIQILEFANTSRTLKTLSVTCRALRSIAQSLLFEKLRIDLRQGLRGSVDDLLANPRICAATRFLQLRGRYLASKKPPLNDEDKLSLIAKLLPKMVGLREMRIYQVHLSRAFIEAFLETAANVSLAVNLGTNIYPPGIGPTSNTPLRISHLYFAASAGDHSSIDFYQSVFRASSTTLTKLTVTTEGDGLAKLADIRLPFLRDLTLFIHPFIRTGNAVPGAGAVAFIIAQRTIQKLDFRGTVSPLPPIPSDALPDLRELNATTKLVNQIVPGRPVEAIEVSNSQRGDQDWFGEEVARSTARVRKLRVHLSTPILDTRMVKRMVTILPFLENLRLPVFDHVRGRLALSPRLILLQALLDVLQVLTSLKYLKHLRISLGCRGYAWVNYNIDVNGIATKLRKANSCFSFIEIRERGESGWKDTASVWNEAFGVFHYMQSVSKF
jgi:hypothetical protein